MRMCKTSHSIRFSGNRTPPSLSNGVRTRTRSLARPLDTAESTETFYDVLGVAASADFPTIKRAYYGLVKECHPDRSTDDDSSNFCVLLNEIYEVIFVSQEYLRTCPLTLVSVIQVLQDPVRRAVYNEIIGLSVSQVNPFLEGDDPADQVFVDEFACIGCRNCSCLCPNTFSIEEEWGRARAYAQGADTEEELQEAIDTCPVSCIHWVSAPQRRLLDDAMGKMERVPVWAMMSGAGANINVFVEASRIWERKMSEQRMEQDIAAADEFWQSVPWAWTGPGADYRYTATGGGAGTGGGASRAAQDAAGRGVTARVSVLAARAAVAARQWRKHQAEQRGKDPQRVLD